MLPETLTPNSPEDERARYKVVRRDSFDDVPGMIVSASALTGACQLRDSKDETKDHNFGPDGLRIVLRGR